MTTRLGSQTRFLLLTGLGLGRVLLVPFAVVMTVQAWVDPWIPHMPWPSHLVPTVILLIVGVESARGVAVGARQLRDSRGLLSWVRALRAPASASVLRAASAAGAGEVVELADPALYAFTIGFRRPRIVVSQGLAARLTAEELTAVLVHEGVHVEGLDPLRALVVRMYEPLPYAPAVDAYLRWRVDRRELVADRRAVDVCGRAALVRALRVVVHDPPRLPGAATVGGTARLLEARLIHLETGNPRPVPPVTRAQLLGSLPWLSVWVLLVGLHVLLSVADHMA